MNKQSIIVSFYFQMLYMQYQGSYNVMFKQIPLDRAKRRIRCSVLPFHNEIHLHVCFIINGITEYCRLRVLPNVFVKQW